jgi:hypothetical protein
MLFIEIQEQSPNSHCTVHIAPSTCIYKNGDGSTAFK